MSSQKGMGHYSLLRYSFFIISCFLIINSKKLHSVHTMQSNVIPSTNDLLIHPRRAAENYYFHKSPILKGSIWDKESIAKIKVNTDMGDTWEMHLQTQSTRSFFIMKRLRCFCFKNNHLYSK